MQKKLIQFCSLTLALAGATLQAKAQGTAFTYQGRLSQGANSANGIYDFTFRLLDGGSNQIGTTVTNPTTPVANGLFTTALDFGMFTGSARWLEVSVRTNGAGPFTTLTPPNPITPTPYALFASNSAAATIASSLTPNSVNSSAIQNGAITSAKIGSGQVVTSLNGLTDNVTLSAGANVTITPNGNSVQISSSGGTASGWALTGNAGTTSANFLGTTDNQPVELRANGARVVRLEPTAGAPNVILGQAANSVSAGVQAATIGGGEGNLVAGNDSVVAGGNGNSAGSNAAFVGGGTINHAKGSSSTLAGGYDNTVSGDIGFIGGGARNRANASATTISGGDNNTASVSYATVAGGLRNNAAGFYSAIGGGQDNAASDESTIGGGSGNNAAGTVATIAGGGGNLASGQYPTVGGGYNNQATGDYGTVPGGFYNTVSGRMGFAAGINAHADHDFSFVWSDGNLPTHSDSQRQFVVRASNGAKFYTEFLTVTGSGGELAYLGGDNVGGDVQIGSLNPLITTVAAYNPSVNSGQGGFMDLIVRTLTITGGADLAEPFLLKEGILEKGSVVVIDGEHPGRLMLSTRAYDTRVAGIVSGANGINPGIALQQEGALEGGQNVALTGRVYVQADASYGPIRPGDLLTTSDTPGHAMKVTNHAKARGAIIGKAMGSLNAGKGMVLVLVSLQ